MKGKMWVTFIDLRLLQSTKFGLRQGMLIVLLSLNMNTTVFLWRKGCFTFKKWKYNIRVSISCGVVSLSLSLSSFSIVLTCVYTVSCDVLIFVLITEL